jgi:hypothetical protein
MDTGKVLENFTPGPCELQKKMAFKLASETPNFVASSLLKIMMLQPTEALSQIREHTSLTGAILKAAVSCERCYANLTPNVGPVSLLIVHWLYE